MHRCMIIGSTQTGRVNDSSDYAIALVHDRPECSLRVANLRIRETLVIWRKVISIFRD